MNDNVVLYHDPIQLLIYKARMKDPLRILNPSGHF